MDKRIKDIKDSLLIIAKKHDYLSVFNMLKISIEFMEIEHSPENSKNLEKNEEETFLIIGEKLPKIILFLRYFDMLSKVMKNPSNKKNDKRLQKIEKYLKEVKVEK